MQQSLQPFHRTFPVHDLEAARHFYEFKAFTDPDRIFAAD